MVATSRHFRAFDPQYRSPPKLTYCKRFRWLSSAPAKNAGRQAENAVGPYFTGSVRKRSFEDFSAGSSITATEVCRLSSNCRNVAIPLVTSSANLGPT